MKKITNGILTLALIFSSCNLYKKYESDNTLEKMSQTVFTIQDTTQSLENYEYHEIFKDDILLKMIDDALANNSTIAKAKETLNQAQYQYDTKKLNYLPTFSFDTQGQIRKWENENATKTYSIGPSFNWQLELSADKTIAKRIAKANLEAEQLYEQEVKTEIITMTAQVYYSLLLLDCQLDINSQTLENWNKNIQTQISLKKAGQTTETAILQARANALSLQNSIKDIELSILENEYQLALLLNLDYNNFKQKYPNRGKIESQEFPEELKTGLPMEILSNRPDVMIAGKNLEMAYYNTKLSTSQLYPALTLSGLLHYTNNNGPISNPGGILMQLLANLSQPIFKHKSLKTNLKISQSKQEIAKTDFKNIVLNAGREVNLALASFQNACQQIDLDNERIEILETTLQKTESLMKYTTHTTYLEVLTAQQSLLSAQLALAQDTYAKILSVINVYQAVGGK